jgi:hypothetical protein
MGISQPTPLFLLPFEHAKAQNNSEDTPSIVGRVARLPQASSARLEPVAMWKYILLKIFFCGHKKKTHQTYFLICQEACQRHHASRPVPLVSQLSGTGLRMFV